MGLLVNKLIFLRLVSTPISVSRILVIAHYGLRIRSVNSTRSILSLSKGRIQSLYLRADPMRISACLFRI